MADIGMRAIPCPHYCSNTYIDMFSLIIENAAIFLCFVTTGFIFMHAYDRFIWSDGDRYYSCPSLR